MGAWLKSNVESRAVCFRTGALEGDNLGVVAAGNLVIAGADDFPCADQHRADLRIWTGAARRFCRQPAGQAQIFFVLRARASLGQRAILFSAEARPFLAPGRPCAP